jgi:predicted permease
MPSYWQLLLLILPVFALIGVGAGLRRVGWLTAEADASLLKVVVNFLYPTLIFDSVLGNAALQQPGNLLYAPIVGFVTMAGGIGLSLLAGRAVGLTTGHGLRTFAFAVGIYNYGYIPIPLMNNLFGKESLGVLMVHNVGCEAAIWTVGILVLSGLSLKEGWRKLFNPPVAALAIAITVNLLHLTDYVPGVVRDVVRLCAACAVPLALLLIGASVWEYVSRPRALIDARITPYACAAAVVSLSPGLLGGGEIPPLPDRIETGHGGGGRDAGGDLVPRHRQTLRRAAGDGGPGGGRDHRGRVGGHSVVAQARACLGAPGVSCAPPVTGH